MRTTGLKVIALMAASILAAGCGEDVATDEGNEVVMRDSLGTPLGQISRMILRANSAQEADMNVLARVEIQPDELLEFYEVAPGVITTSAAGRPLGAPRMGDPNLRRLNPVQIWQQMVGPRAMPLALAEAVGRAKNVVWQSDVESDNDVVAAASDSSTAAASSHRSHGIVAGPNRGVDQANDDNRAGALRAPAVPTQSQGNWCDTGWFDHQSSQCSGDIEVCLDDHWNGAWGQANRVWSYDGAVCAATGKVIYNARPSKKWQTVVRNVPADTYRASWGNWQCFGINPANCPNVRVEITDAAGDRFHFRFTGMRE